MPVRLYRKKPVVVEAIQYNGNNEKECERFSGERLQLYTLKNPVETCLLWRAGMISVGDFLIKDSNGIVSLCKKDDFEELYELIEENKMPPKEQGLVPVLNILDYVFVLTSRNDPETYDVYHENRFLAEVNAGRTWDWAECYWKDKLIYDSQIKGSTGFTNEERLIHLYRIAAEIAEKEQEANCDEED